MSKDGDAHLINNLQLTLAVRKCQSHLESISYHAQQAIQTQ